MKTGRKNAVQKYSTDSLATNLWLKLVKDFRAVQGENFCLEAEKSFMTGMDNYRDYKYPTLGEIPVHRFKAYAQLESLVKKYRYEHDRFTDTELETLTFDSYIKFQDSISLPMTITQPVFLVLQEARKIVKGILGSLEPEAILNNARFGRKSSIGCPLSLAYIDIKLSNVKAFTGSSACAKWFYEQVLSGDSVLDRIISRLPQKGRDGDLAHESLTLINVPKTWKTLRTITPLTLLGLYYSYGVGRVITQKLAQVGLDISSLQLRHRKWVCTFSRTLSHVTADLTRASDSITPELLARVLPREWYKALSVCLTHQVVYDGKSYYTSSVLPMGNGATFPVETLIFYSIIKAIGNLSKTGGIYSVYGDDLIYPRGIHSYVKSIFPKIHFTVNDEKTFIDSSFRESCGADYYRGCDVRPYFYKGQSRMLTRTQYASEIYKVYNGLQRRWSEHEIRGTLYFLLTELSCLGLPIFRVPPNYPDYAGIKVDFPEFIPLDCVILNWQPIEASFKDGSRWYQFRCLHERSKDRFVVDVEPYYWLALQGLSDVASEYGARKFSMYATAPASSLSWRKLKRSRCYQKKGRTIRKIVAVFKPVVAEKIAATLCECTGSVSDWI